MKDEEQIGSYILDFVKMAITGNDAETSVVAQLILSLEGEGAFKFWNLSSLSEENRIKANTVIADFLATNQRPSYKLSQIEMDGSGLMKEVIAKWGLPQFKQSH
ncbi:MAG: hypothetical protein GJ680_08185 [Alteromonadaceae bacterium]|nr:hypothetical protein [Alteromonadaceae bacterium]